MPIAPSEDEQQSEVTELVLARPPLEWLWGAELKPKLLTEQVTPTALLGIGVLIR